MDFAQQEEECLWEDIFQDKSNRGKYRKMNTRCWLVLVLTASVWWEPSLVMTQQVCALIHFHLTRPVRTIWIVTCSKSSVFSLTRFDKGKIWRIDKRKVLVQNMNLARVWLVNWVSFVWRCRLSSCHLPLEAKWWVVRVDTPDMLVASQHRQMSTNQERWLMRAAKATSFGKWVHAGCIERQTTFENSTHFSNRNRKLPGLCRHLVCVKNPWSSFVFHFWTSLGKNILTSLLCDCKKNNFHTKRWEEIQRGVVRLVSIKVTHQLHSPFDLGGWPRRQQFVYASARGQPFWPSSGRRGVERQRTAEPFCKVDTGCCRRYQSLACK